MSWSLERRGRVVTCTHANPPRHTLTAAGVQSLHEQLDALERDPSLRVLVLTGGGEGVFVAHYEVGELAAAAHAPRGGAGQAPAKERIRLHPFHALCLRLERLSAITLAALNGNAAGGGCELALACDFRLIADGPFHFGLPETSVGIIPGAGGTQRLARLLGTARALDLILHAKLLAPHEAFELGLVHRVVAVADFAVETQRFAEDLAGRAPIALAAAKRAIRMGVELPLAEGLALEQQEFERCMRSKDAAGALRAFLAGERWDWKGE